MQMNPLQKQGVGDFRYFVGTSSLAQIAAKLGLKPAASADR